MNERETYIITKIQSGRWAKSLKTDMKKAEISKIFVEMVAVPRVLPTQPFARPTKIKNNTNKKEI